METSPQYFAILGGVVGSLTSFVFLRLMNVRWKHRTRAEWIGDEMVLRQPSIRPWLGVGVIASIPFILVIGALMRGPSNPPTIPMAVFIAALGVVVGASVWMIARRIVTVGPEAIELKGIFGRRIVWAQIATVQAFRFPHRTVIVFCRDHGKAIAVDSTYYGWEEFLEKLSEIAPKAGSKVATAIRRLDAAS